MTNFSVATRFVAIDRLSAPMARMERSARAFSNKMSTMSQKAGNISRGAALGAAAIAAPLVLATKNAVEFEDKLADVAKTTGLQGQGLAKFGSELLEMSTKTRTSADELLKIAEIGGQLGINPSELNGFVEAINKFNVALGADFAGGVEEAASQVGKIQKLFAQTRGLSAPETIMRAGSAINELGAVGAGTSANITDFTLRMGALPDALKPSITNTLALGTFLEELGLGAEIGAGGMTKFLLVAGKEINSFAGQMKMSATDAKALLAQDPLEFTKKFAATFKGLKPDVLAKKLHSLKIGTQETIKVLGTMAGSTERLNELQAVSNDSFDKATSLSDEYAKKEGTAAASVARLKNQITAFSIEVGNNLIPVLSDVISEITPVIKRFSEWARKNPETLKTVIKFTLGIAAFLAVVAVVAAVVSGVTAALSLYGSAVAIVTGAQLLFNAAMLANPFIMLALGVTALIALVLKLSGGWDVISRGFQDGGIIGGIKAIGAAILDLLLLPVQQLIVALSKIPGMGGLKDTANSLAMFRLSMGLTKGIDENFIPRSNTQLMDPGAGVLKSSGSGDQSIMGGILGGSSTPAINPEAEKQKSFSQMIEKKQSQNVSIGINDNTGRATVDSDNNIVPIVLNKSLKVR